jgi:hypothetical protein
VPSQEAISSSAPWCTGDHTADEEEGAFGGFGGHGCQDGSAKAECTHLGGQWCRSYVDNQVLLCACKERAMKTCGQGALASGHLQTGSKGGPDARSAVHCESGFTLCRVDPHGPDNDVCGNADDCYACSR